MWKELCGEIFPNIFFHTSCGKVMKSHKGLVDKKSLCL